MFEFQITGEHAQQLDLYNRNELSESVKAGERLLEHLRKQKKEVFPSERNEFLVPIIRFFDNNPFLTQKTPPHIIAEMAMQMADFRKANAKDGYLSEHQLSRCIQKVRLILYGE